MNLSFLSLLAFLLSRGLRVTVAAPLKEDECVIMFKVTEGREEDKNVLSWPGEVERGTEWGDMWNLVCWPTQTSLKLFLCLFPIS